MPTIDAIHLRAAQVEDAPRIAALIASVSHYFTLDPGGCGAEHFLQSMSEAALASYISNPAFFYSCAWINGQLAGVVAIRDAAHLFHLFVAPAFQGAGLGRCLWVFAQQQAQAAGNTGHFTVNSTPYAVPVYQRFGFEATGPRVERDGIAYVPMALQLATHAA